MTAKTDYGTKNGPRRQGASVVGEGRSTTCGKQPRANGKNEGQPVAVL